MHKYAISEISSRSMRLLPIWTLISALMLPAYALGGTLEAPYPPTPANTTVTRHKLKDIYDLIKTGAETSAIPAGVFSDPPSGATIGATISGSTHTLNDIYDAAPKPDGAGALPNQVCSGRKYFSLLTGSTSPTTGTWGADTGSRDCNSRPVALNYLKINVNATPSLTYNIDYSTLISDDTAINETNIEINTVNAPKGKGAITKDTANNRFTYNPNGQFDFLPYGEKAYDYFSYRYTDASGAYDDATVVIEITGVNHSPVIEANKSLGLAASATVTITSARLSVIDTLEAAADINYSITGLTAGILEAKTSTTSGCTGSYAIVTSFNQRQINNDCVQYTATATKGHESFNFSASDGTTSVSGTFDIYVY